MPSVMMQKQTTEIGVGIKSNLVLVLSLVSLGRTEREDHSSWFQLRRTVL
jgi:hypothetical protein